MKKFINWLKSLFVTKELVSEKIVKKAPKTKRGSGSSKSTFTKSGVSQSATKELVSEKIVKKAPKTKRGSGSSKSTFTKSGVSKGSI